jgi:acetyltransferase-like isoleucine patch superfamily enzyme
MVGPNVSIITTGHPLTPSERRSVTIGKPIVIERDVWLATGATTLSGITIGENSVAAAGSVVTKDVQANMLVAGNPAHIIRTVSDEQQTRRLNVRTTSRDHPAGQAPRSARRR